MLRSVVASHEDALALAESLTGQTVSAVLPCSGGGNNRVYRVQTPGHDYAMKCYGAMEPNRDRLGREFDGLRFLNAHGSGAAVPVALSVERNARCALYEWIDGTPVRAHGPNDITALLELLALLRAAGALSGATQLGPATEAVLAPSDLLAQLDLRVGRLARARRTEPELASLLATLECSEIARWRSRLERQRWNKELANFAQTLSPSDVGFHNALRRPDGSLCFIDFEYFGWDDPVKLTADVLWHPAVSFSPEQRRAFVAGTMLLFGNDERFPMRLELYYPLYGIRWALIMLNPFIPLSWARRRFAGNAGELADAKRTQLRRARKMLDRVRDYAQGVYDT